MKITELIEIGSKYVETNINLNSIKDYIPYILDFNLSNLKSETLPGESKKINGVWLIIPNKIEINRTIEDMF